MEQNRKEFKVAILEGDAIIHLKRDKTVALVFAEDGNTIAREMVWPDHEIYKTAVQFALMIDSYFKNGDGLDSLIINSPTGNLAAELLGKDLLQISLAGAGDMGELYVDEQTNEDTAEQEGKDIYSGNIPDNVLDLTEKLKKKEDNEKE